jgi:hypothetical protein
MMNIQIIENKKVPVSNTGAVNNLRKGFSNPTEFVYDKHFRRKAFFRHLINNREFRTVVLTGFSVVLTLFTTLVLVLIPLMRNLIY